MKQRNFAFFVTRSPVVQACERDAKAAKFRIDQTNEARQAFELAVEQVERELLSLLERQSQPA
jgi:hypothetical protein